MAWVWAAVAVLLGVGIMTLLSNIRLRVLYVREGHDDLLRIQIRALYGIVRLKYEVTVMDWQGRSVSIKQEMVNVKKQSLQNESKSRINRRKVMHMVRELRELTAHVLGFSAWVRKTLSAIRCHGWEWETRIGLVDAADTAMTTGIVWSIKSCISGPLLGGVRLLNRPKLSVIPLFHEDYFETRLQSRFSIRFSSALWALLNLLVRILKVKGGLRKWRKHLART